MSKWKIHIFGTEVSVVKTDNTHGQNSYGWYGKDKILVAYLDPNRCSKTVMRFLSFQHQLTAHVLCRKLNERQLRP
jgi:hypothetical protein